MESAVSGFKYSDALNEIEGVLIEIIEPKLNKQGGKIKDATEFRQFIDEEVQDVSTNDLIDEVRKISARLSKS